MYCFCYCCGKIKLSVVRDMFTRLLDPDVWKPVLIVNITNMLITWCAIQALDRYVVVIFKASGSNVGKQKFIHYEYINLLVFLIEDREV